MSTTTTSSMPPIDGPVERICVFRALMLGDLLCAVPALRALRAAFPRATITLVGLPWARVLAERFDCIDDVIEFPGYPGLPERRFDCEDLPEFLKQVQARHFDIALQLHGSGKTVNSLVATFGARQTAGFFDAATWVPPEDERRYVAWPQFGHEIERLLVLIDALHLPRCGSRLEFPLIDEDRNELEALWPAGLPRTSYVCVHAGSQLASRRWLPQRFAMVADALADEGYTIVLTGSSAESAVVARVAEAMRHQPVSFVGKTSLWTLGALIEGAEHVVCNDTGVSHIAAALGTPSVVVSCGSDVARWAPLDTRKHQVVWAAMPCRPCSVAICPEPRGCAQLIEVEDVLHAMHSVEASA